MMSARRSVWDVERELRWLPVSFELTRIALVPGSGGSYVTTAAQAASCNTSWPFVAHPRT